MKILITAGATFEPIDGVRGLTNVSTGKTGALIADSMVAHGHDVVYICGQQSARPNSLCKIISFTNFQNLSSTLQNTLSSQSFDLVIHAAAVSDYSIQLIEADDKFYSPKIENKISSDAEQIRLTLKRNFKIISKLKEYSLNKNIKIIAFKLTNTSNQEERLRSVLKLWDQGGIDLIVHNDLHELSLDTNKHISRIYSASDLIFENQTKEQLVQRMVQFVGEGS